MRIVHICSCCTCAYNCLRLYAFLVYQPRRLLVRNLIYLVIIFLAAGNFYFSLVSTFYITQKQKKNKNYLRQKINHNNILGCIHILDRQCFSLDNKQQTIKKKQCKLTIPIAQINWKISQAEAVRFCCFVVACKNKFNYFKCEFQDIKNVQWKTNSSLSILSSTVVGCCCTFDFCVCC